MNPPAFLEIFQNILDAILFSPATPTEYWVTLVVGLLVMLGVIFQTQIYFGAGQSNLPTAIMSLLAGLGVMMIGAIVTKLYIFPAFPSDLLSNTYQFFTNIIGEGSLTQPAMENIILFLFAIILLFAIGCPMTASFCRSSQFAAGWSWLFALIIGMGAFFLVHIAFVHGKQTVKSTDALQESETQQKKSLLDGEKQ